MHAALRALLDAPQNNLTVRVGGKLVFGGAGCFGKAPLVSVCARATFLNARLLIRRRIESCVLRQDDVEHLSNALEPFAPEGATRGERVDMLLRLVIAALLRHNALRRLLAVQKLDTHDVEGAYQARFSIQPPRSASRNSRAPHRQAYEALLKDLDGADAATGGQPQSCHLAMPRGRALAVLRDFLTAQSAKDCAIMVALQPLPAGFANAGDDDVLVVDAATNLTWRCEAAFVDLDLKRVTKMPHYLALERAVVAHFEEHTTAG